MSSKMELAKNIEKARKNIRKKYRKLMIMQGHKKNNMQKMLTPFVVFNPPASPEKPVEEISKDAEMESFVDNLFANQTSEKTPVAKKDLSLIKDSENEIPVKKTPERHFSKLVIPITAEQYFDQFIYDAQADKVFGPELRDGVWKLGNEDFSVQNNHFVVGDLKIPATKGLNDLIFKKNLLPTYSEQDFQNYARIVHKTRVGSSGKPTLSCD